MEGDHCTVHFYALVYHSVCPIGDAFCIDDMDQITVFSLKEHDSRLARGLNTSIGTVNHLWASL